MAGSRRTSGRVVLLGWASAVIAAVFFVTTGWGWYSVGQLRLCLPGDESHERWCKVSAVSKAAPAKKAPETTGGRDGGPHYGKEEGDDHGLYECVTGTKRDGCTKRFGAFVKTKSAEALHGSYVYHATAWNRFFTGGGEVPAARRFAFGIAVGAIFGAFLSMLVKITADWLGGILSDNDW